MADTIRGNGLFIAHNSLAALVEDPQLLDRMRSRFNEPPPSYRSRESGTPTRSQSSNPPTPGELDRAAREIELYIEHGASFPSKQFDVQIAEECRRIYRETHGPRSPHRPWVPGPELEVPATENVKKRWVEQGIWKDEWNNQNNPRGLWKHEEPLKSESESESDSGGEGPSGFNFFTSIPEQPAAKKQKSKKDARQIAERRAVLEREREASRPYHQFLWQVSRERERMENEQQLNGNLVGEHADINSRAYVTIKSKWTKQGMWHMKWDILPGMWWKHEQPREEFLASDPIYNPPNRHEDRVREAIPEPIREYESPWNIFGTPEPPQAPQAPPQSPGAIRDDRPEVDLPEVDLPDVDPPEVGRPEVDPPEVDRPNDLLNVPSVAKARRGRPRRRSVQDGSGEPSSTAPTAPRRSKRLQEANLNAAQDTTAPRRKRAVTGNPKTASSAKPQGISKAQRSTTTKRRTRKR